MNAGLLTLSQALWVLFGANVGTTMTGWLVALVGLKLDVEALALPLVGGGMLLRLTGGGRRGAAGTAAAGFGVLFLGIDILQGAFVGLADDLKIPQAKASPTSFSRCSSALRSRWSCRARAPRWLSH